MSLLLFEMKKLFLKRNTLVIILLFILIPLIPNLMGEINYYSNNGEPGTLYGISKPYEGDVDPEIAQKANDEIMMVLNRKMSKTGDANIFGDNSREQIDFYFDYSNADHGLNSYQSGDIREKPEKPYSLRGIKNRMETLEKEGKKDSYEYVMRVMQYSMLVESGEPGFHYVKSWRNLFSFLTMGSGFLFTAFLLLLVIAPVFSNERVTGMDSIILSSRNGRVKVVTAKLAASVIFASVFVIVYNLSQLAGYIGVGGAMGWDAPLKSILGYALCPYNITILQFFLIQLVLQLLGSIMLTAAIAFVSSVSRSSLASFFISLLVIFYPYILGVLLRISAEWLQPLIDLSMLKLAVAHDAFAAFKAFNLFGSPVLYINVLIPLVIAMGIIFILLTYRQVRRQQVC